MSSKYFTAAAGVLSLCLLVACISPPPAPPAPEGAPADFPIERYAGIDGTDRLYAIEPGRSLAAIHVRRGGALARLGHDHVIAARDIRGFVRLRDGVAFADLYATLAGMSVDEQALRAEAGFTTEPSAEDKADTRANMLKSVDAKTYPFVQATLSAPIGTAAETVDADVTIALHGQKRRYSVPIAVTVSAATLSASGSLKIRQSDFGIEPFSVLAGAPSVQDELDIRFEIGARRRFQSAVSDSGSVSPSNETAASSSSTNPNNEKSSMRSG